MSSPPHTLTADDVRKVARLARLALTPEQVEPARAALGALLHYIDRIKAVDLTGIEPLFSPTDQESTAREDTPGDHLSTQTLLDAAPATFGHFIRVPKVLGQPGTDPGASA